LFNIATPEKLKNTGGFFFAVQSQAHSHLMEKEQRPKCPL